MSDIAQLQGKPWELTYASRASINAIFDQFFDHRTQIHNDLAGLNLMDLRVCQSSALWVVLMACLGTVRPSICLMVAIVKVHWLKSHS